MRELLLLIEIIMRNQKEIVIEALGRYKLVTYLTC